MGPITLLLLSAGYLVYKNITKDSSNISKPTLTGKAPDIINKYVTDSTYSQSDCYQIFYIAGIKHYQNEQELKSLMVGIKLEIVREPNNPYDTNAIALYTTNKNKLGYIPKSQNNKIAKCIDSGDILKVEVIGIDHTANSWEKVLCRISKS